MALPLENRLNTNYAPSDEELQKISRILIEPQARLARMNDEIERVQETLDEMKRQRDELVRLIDQYHALASPIRRIPHFLRTQPSQEAFLTYTPQEVEQISPETYNRS